MEKGGNILLIFMDIDHLRRINNDCGRVVGDEVVVAAVIYDPEEDKDALSEKLDKEICSYNRNSRYRLSIARGFSFIRDEKGNLKTTGEWKYEADQECEI